MGKDADDDDEYEDEEPDPITFGRALELTYDGAFWSGELRLRSLDKLIKGRDKALLVEVDAPDGTLPKPVHRGLTWLIANQAAVGKALIEGLVAGFPAIRADAIAHGNPDAAKLPAAVTAKTLAKIAEPTSFTIHQTVYGPRPYLGFELHATWEREHGVGVLMHGTRIVQIGDADVALDEYAPATDRRKQRAKRAKPKAKRRGR